MSADRRKGSRMAPGASRGEGDTVTQWSRRKPCCWVWRLRGQHVGDGAVDCVMCSYGLGCSTFVRFSRDRLLGPERRWTCWPALLAWAQCRRQRAGGVAAGTLVKLLITVTFSSWSQKQLSWKREHWDRRGYKVVLRRAENESYTELEQWFSRCGQGHLKIAWGGSAGSEPFSW